MKTVLHEIAERLEAHNRRSGHSETLEAARQLRQLAEAGEGPLRIGDTLYGFCDGEFGRDSYGPKRVEAIGSDWVVVREDDGTPNWSFLDNPDHLCKHRNEDLQIY